MVNADFAYLLHGGVNRYARAGPVYRYAGPVLVFTFVVECGLETGENTS